MTLDNVIEQHKKNDRAVMGAGEDHCPKFSFTAGRGNQPKTVHCSTCSAHQFSLCSGLDGEKLLDFGNASSHKTIKPGQMLFGEYDDAKYFYTVVSGEVRLSRMLDDGRRQITGFKSIGDFIGLSTAKHYAADAEAIDEVVVCQFSVTSLNNSMKEYPEIQSRLMGMMQAEVIHLQNHMVLLGRKTPIEKIANFLCERAYKKFQTEGKPDEVSHVEIMLPMGRTDIADFLGLTIETVSRTFTKLRKLNVIELKTSQDIEIHDLYELQALANGER